jgi:hypothetical protein
MNLKLQDRRDSADVLQVVDRDLDVVELESNCDLGEPAGELQSLAAAQ